MGLQETRAQATRGGHRQRQAGRMRLLGTSPLFIALGLLVSTPSPGSAQTDLGDVVATGEVEVGGRVIPEGSSDFGSSEYEEYREQRPGVFGNARLLLEGKEGKYYFEGSATDIAERDQHYEIASGRYGRYRLELEFDELVHVFSNTARSPYTDQGDGVLTLAAQPLAVDATLNSAPRVPLRFRLQTGRVGFFYRPLADLEVNAGYWVQQKEGARPFGMAFGTPGSNFVNVAGPIDERTHEVTGGIQLARDAWSLRLDYTASFYENDLDTMTVDNPLVAADTAASGSRRGRTDLAPDNSAHTVSLTGAATLPLGFPARFAGTFSYGMRFQNDPFIPHTINSAISDPSLTLPANSLDAEVRTLLANLVLTGRPVRDLNLTARYRFYDYNSDIPLLAFPGHVINDRSLDTTATRFNTPMDHHTHNASLDGSYRVAPATTLKVGYEWERWDRSDHREVVRTDEHTAKAAVDYKPTTWALLRAGYRFGIRRGTDYNTFAHLEHAVLEDTPPAELVGQSLLLRKFDEADRVRNQVDLLAQLSPRDDLTLAFTGGYGLTDYDNTTLGLTEDQRWSVGSDIGYRPLDWLALSAWYTFENIRFKQESRWRPNTTTNDPVNDWSSTSEDQVHTAGVGADILLIPDRLDASLSYILEIAKAKTLAVGAPGTTNALDDRGNAVDWPDIKDTLQTFIAALRYHIVKNLTVKAEYRFEHFNLANFKTDALEPFTPSASTTDVFLGDRVEDYVAHVIALSLIYRF